MGLVSLFATSLAAPAAKNASTRTALTREKGGPATARMKPMPYPRDRVSLMIPVPSLLGRLTMVPVPVARRMSPYRLHQPPQLHHVTQRSNANLHIQEQDSGASVGIKVSLAETVPVRTYLAVSQFVTERVVRAVRSVSTKSVHPRERAGAATTERQQLLYPRVHVSLIALALVLLAPPTKILHVHAANQRSHLSPVKTKDVPKSGTGWGPVLMCPTQTGHQWMLAST